MTAECTHWDHCDCDDCIARCKTDMAAVRVNRFQRDIDHWNETGTCLRHFSIDTPPRFCEQCGKPWTAVMDGREGRRNRRNRAIPSSKKTREEGIPGGLLDQAKREGLM